MEIIPIAQLLIALGICLFLYWCGRALYESVKKPIKIGSIEIETTEEE